MRPGAADHRDDERRARQTLALELDLLGRRFGMIGAENLRDRLAGFNPCIALEHDEPPRRELAVVGHARGDGQ